MIVLHSKTLLKIQATKTAKVTAAAVPTLANNSERESARAQTRL